MINVQKVREKVQTLVENMSISKTKLGEVLGGKTQDDPRVKINRANRFLSGDKKTISIQELNALAGFFGKPIEWFLFDDDTAILTHTLASSDEQNASASKPLQEIEKNLRAMGFDEAFIKAQITQLKAMEAYRQQR